MIMKTETDMQKLDEEMVTISALTEKLIKENATNPMSQDEYSERYDGYAERFRKAERAYEKLKNEKVSLLFQEDALGCEISTVSNIPELPIDFQEHHWNGLIDHATVYEDETIEFTFKSGAVISREI